MSDMLLITKKRKNRIAAHLGFLWFYIRRIVEPEEFMDAADAAAYQAKDNGRNCYIIRDVE